MTGFLLPLQGPMQAYGDEGFLSLRGAGSFPSRSAVLGAIAAALGLRRGDPSLVDLHAALRVHVATLRPGTPLVDYHTVEPRDWSDPDALDRKVGKVQTYRTYHHDAEYLALVEGEPEIVAEARAALLQPVFAAYLGRRSCPPATPLLPHRAPAAASPEAVLVAAADRVLAAPSEGAGWPWGWPRGRRRPDPRNVLDVYIEGHREAVGVEAPAPVYGLRRDLLVAAPRHYVDRPVTHLRVRQEVAGDEGSNAYYFDAADG